ncbi:MAG: DUF3137 domain-containing protein [Pseudomonadales bacterium]
MAEMIAVTDSEPTSATVSRQESMGEVYARLNVQRKAAIKCFWLTTLQCLVYLPLALTPVAGFGFLIFEHPPGSALAELAKLGRALILPVDTFVILGGMLWLFIGLYLLGRHFRRRGQVPVWNYVADYKRCVFKGLCDAHFPGLAYDPKGYVGYDEFDATRLFDHTSDEYRSEDYFSGRVGKTDVHFAEVVAKRERKYWHNGRRRTTYEEFFHGLVFVAEFHKHFHSTSRLVPRGEKLARVPGQLSVTLEDPEFEELFATVSTDAVDVRYILSTSMVRRFVKLHRRFPGMRVLFERDKVLLALPTYRNLFEPTLYRDAGSSGQVDQFVKDIRSLMQVIEALDLNTRIWSKE